MEILHLVRQTQREGYFINWLILVVDACYAGKFYRQMSVLLLTGRPLFANIVIQASTKPACEGDDGLFTPDWIMNQTVILEQLRANAGRIPRIEPPMMYSRSLDRQVPYAKGPHCTISVAFWKAGDFQRNYDFTCLSLGKSYSSPGSFFDGRAACGIDLFCWGHELLFNARVQTVVRLLPTQL
jgi:hypothetical protein